MAPQSNTALRITELDFGSIKSNLKDYLRSQKQFQDFDFDGSGMSVLLDILAYNTHYMSYYLNMVGNEMFLDTAQLRDSLLSHAKLINYVPQSRIGAVAQISVKITPDPNTEDTSNQIITLDKYTRFIGESIDGMIFPFVTLYSNTAFLKDGAFQFNNVWIKQGEVITRQYAMTPDNIKRTFFLPSANVDVGTITVAVQKSPTTTETIVYNKADDLMEITSESPVYFVEERDSSKYAIYFGDNIIGKKPDDGSIIRVSYIDTNGPDTNKIGNFSTTEYIGGYNANIDVKTESSSFGGSEKESIEQIRFRAPYFYSTQNRAVTKSDYETLLQKDYPYIESISVWGGEDNDPIQYGKIFLSIKTKNNYALSDLEKENIKETLIRNRNVLTVQPEIVDPDISYVRLRGKVTYNPSLTLRTANEIRDLIYAAIQDYVDQDLNRFDSVFRKSRLQYFIENADPSITGSDFDLYIQKRQFIEVGLKKSYKFKYGLPVKQGDYINRLKSFPRISVLDDFNTERQVFIEEVPDAFTGIARIAVKQTGTGYISAPTIEIVGDGTGATADAVIVNGKIQKINVTNRGVNYTTATVYITGGGGVGAVASAITDITVGTLRTYYYKENGQKVIVDPTFGGINYATGVLTIKPFIPLGVEVNDLYESDYLTIESPTEDEILYPKRNTILTLDIADPSAITVNVLPET